MIIDFISRIRGKSSVPNAQHGTHGVKSEHLVFEGFHCMSSKNACFFQRKVAISVRGHSTHLAERLAPRSTERVLSALSFLSPGGGPRLIMSGTTGVKQLHE